MHCVIIMKENGTQNTMGAEDVITSYSIHYTKLYDRSLREDGITMIVVEHVMEVVMPISDRVVVLDYGRKIGDGTPDEVRANQEVIDAYLGVAH